MTAHQTQNGYDNLPIHLVFWDSSKEIGIFLTIIKYCTFGTVRQNHSVEVFCNSGQRLHGVGTGRAYKEKDKFLHELGKQRTRTCIE